MNINTVIFGGRLAADPEIRILGETKVANIRIISNRVYYKNVKGKEKEKCEEVIAMDAELWAGRATAAEYLSKGDGCVVEGYLKENSWENEDGVKKYKKTIQVQKLHFGQKKGGDIVTTNSDNNNGNQEKNKELKLENQGSEDVPF